MRSRLRSTIFLGAATAFLVALAPLVAAQEIQWMRWFGLSPEAAQGVSDVAVDGSGAVYAAGTVEFDGIEELPAPPPEPGFGTASSPLSEGFVRKYSASGDHVWTRYVSAFEKAIHVSAIDVDDAGNSYVAGGFYDPFSTEFPSTSEAIVRRYDPDGNVVWTDQFGGEGETGANGVAIGAEGDVFVAGFTEAALGGSNAGSADIFVRRYGPSGEIRWTRQFGEPGFDTTGEIVADPAGNLFLLTSSFDPAAGDVNSRAYVMKLAADGSLIWTRQIDTDPFPETRGLTVDPDGNSYVLREVFLDPEIQIEDWQIDKFSPQGDLVWSKRFGEPQRPERGFGVVAGASGLYVTGQIGSLADYLGQRRPPSVGPPTTGAFVTRLTLDGVETWTTIFGSEDEEFRSRGSGIDLGPAMVAVVGGDRGSMFAASLSAGTSCAGTSSPDSEETGVVSAPVHRLVEPLTGPAEPAVHDLNCTVVAPLGL